MSLFPTIPQPLSRFILSQLRRSLPPAVMDSPEELEIRELVAQAAIARLAPANTGEALLAVRAIAAEAHATDALQSVHQHRDDFRRVAQCRAQSALMTRQGMALRKELRAVQAIRLDALREQEEAMEAAALAAVMAGDAEAAREEAPAPQGPAEPELEGATPDNSQGMRQIPTVRSCETHSRLVGRPWTSGHPEVVLLAAFILAAARNGGAPQVKSAVHDAA